MIKLYIHIYIFGLHLQLLAHSFAHPYNFLTNKAMRASFVIIFGLLSPVPKNIAEH